MANNTKVLEIINQIEEMELGFSPAKLMGIMKEVLAHPERADSIVEALATAKEEKRDADEYAEGAVEDYLKREAERKAAKEAAKKQAQELDNKIRNAALVNIMRAEDHPVYGTKAFDEAFQREYKALKAGKNLTFDPAGGAFVYDCELSHLSDEQREAVELAQQKVRISNKAIQKMLKRLPDGKHHFRINDIKQKEVNGQLRQTLTLEEEQTGYTAWITWINDGEFDPRDYRMTREYQLQQYSDEHDDMFAGQTLDAAVEVLMQTGLTAWSFTPDDARKTDDGKMFARVFLNEHDYQYAVKKARNRSANRADYESRKRETKATSKF